MRLLFVLLLSAPFAVGEIVWETTHIDREAHSAEHSIKERFEGKNTGKETVKIRQVISSCNCLSAEISSRTVEPGESVRLDVEFAINDRRGLQTKTVELRTEPSTNHRQVLTLRTEVRDDLYFDRNTLYWSPNRPITSLPVRIRVLRKEPLFVTGVESGDPRMRVSLYEIQPGREYRAEVTPTDLSRLFETELRFSVRDPEGENFVIPIRAAVR